MQVLIPSAVLAPVSIIASLLVLAVAAVVGALTPARRAAQVDPLFCLRAQ